MKQTDIQAIEKLHEEDVLASKQRDYLSLKTLMDKDCRLFPNDSEPEYGPTYLDKLALSSREAEEFEQLVELEQEWEELILMGDFAFEQGLVKITLRNRDGALTRYSQRLMRLLKRQQDGSWGVYRAMWHAPVEYQADLCSA